MANHVVEGAREGKTVAGLMKSAREILKRADVMPGVSDMTSSVVRNAAFEKAKRHGYNGA
ncbi:MAG: urease subunit gamma [Candidatus Nitrosopolaris sp.]